MSGKLFLDVPNACSPSDGICTGGHPQPEHLRDAAQRGVRYVINLCPAAENPGYDEAALVQSLGMHYVNIPVAGPPDITEAKARQLAAALTEAGEAPVLVHCASGNRVGALFALKAHYLDGADIDQALAAGRAAGLKTLEPAVRARLMG